MQVIELDISRKTEVAAIEAKQDDVGRKFQAVILENGEPFTIPAKAVISLWYSGTGGEGNYVEIDGKIPFTVHGNTVTVELICQMLRLPGGGQMCLVIVDQQGKQIGLWNIPYHVEKIPGAGSKTAQDHYNALTRMLESMKTDRSLSVSGKPADAKTVGEILKQLSHETRGLAYHVVQDDAQLDDALLAAVSQMERWSRHNCVIFMEGTDAVLPYGIWVFELTRTDTHVQIWGVSGGMTVTRTYKDSMLTNGSFEMDAQIPGWNSSNPAVSFISSDTVRSGKYAMMIRGVSDEVSCRLISDPVAASPGMSYTATAYVCGATAGHIGLRFCSDSGEEISQETASFNAADGVWSPITVTGDAPDGTVQVSVILAADIVSPGTAYFDDAELQVTGGTWNLLENPSFEQEQRIPGWTCDSVDKAMLTNEKVNTGNGRCAVKLVDNSNSASVQLISKPVEVIPTEQYAVSADFTGEGMCQLWLRFYDGSGKLLSQPNKTIIPNKTGWSHSQLSAYAPARAKKVCVALITEKTVPASLYVDNVFLAMKKELDNYESNIGRFSPWLWSGQTDGKIASGGAVDNLEHLSQLVCTTLKTMDVSSAIDISVICNFTNGSSAGKLTVHKAVGGDNIHQATAMLVTANGDILLGTSYDEYLNGNWQPIEWSWSNPPMEDDIEYRTTERHRGKAVYTKLVYFGSLPNASESFVNHNIALTQVLRCSAYIVGGDSLPAFMNANNYRVTVYCSKEYIIVETTKDMLARPAYVQVWYTKD